MARCVVALGQEDVVIDSALKRLVERNWLTQELLLDLAEAV